MPISRSPRRVLRRLAPLAAACAMPAVALAQFGGSVSATTDDRFRGASLSGEKPAARATLSYDSPSGAYGGVSASNMRFGEGSSRLGLLGYVGATRRLSSTWSIDGGLTYTAVPGAGRYDYAEAYVGLDVERWSARLSYSPDYFGRGVRTLYASLEFRQPLSTALDGFVHVGSLKGLGGPAEDSAVSNVDASLGLALRPEGRAFSVQTQVVGTNRSDAYLGMYRQRRGAFTLSVSYSF